MLIWKILPGFHVPTDRSRPGAWICAVRRPSVRRAGRAQRRNLPVLLPLFELLSSSSSLDAFNFLLQFFALILAVLEGFFSPPYPPHRPDSSAKSIVLEPFFVFFCLLFFCYFFDLFFWQFFMILKLPGDSIWVPWTPIFAAKEVRLPKERPPAVVWTILYYFQSLWAPRNPSRSILHQKCTKNL